MVLVSVSLNSTSFFTNDPVVRRFELSDLPRPESAGGSVVE